MVAKTMDQLVSLCKRRGFIFQNADIYGGMQGVYDYGPLGVELKNNLKAAWWRAMVYERDDIEGLDAAILTNRKVLHYSGHEDTFSDPMTDCRKCKGRFRADHIKDGKCPNCGSTDLTEPRPFNLMFKTTVGPVDNAENLAYLRPETAQAIFTQFKNVVDSTSRKLPFGIAQIGKSFRNEIKCGKKPGSNGGKSRDCRASTLIFIPRRKKIWLTMPKPAMTLNISSLTVWKNWKA